MRVIAGELGGRHLASPRGASTRPTTDRVREALFAILGDLTGAVVLDLFAGTGALGIEALSRGAARAVFVEQSRPALKALSQNLRELGLLERSRVLASPVKNARASIVELGPYDLVLADPPYEDSESALGFVAELTQSHDGLLAPGATIVLEHDARKTPEGAMLTLVSTRRYGDSALSFYSSG